MADVREVSGRVDRLEEIMMQLAYEHTKTEMALQDFKREMSNFKRGMQDFKDEMRASKKENDRHWGDLANKMGTLVEDIVAPSLPRIVREDFGCGEIDDIMLRRRVRNKTDPAQVREFDALVVAGDLVFINETKSRPDAEKVYDFIQVLKIVHEFLPEYGDKRIVPLFSSLYIPEDILNLLTKNNIFALAMGEDTMQVLNLEQIDY